MRLSQQTNGVSVVARPTLSCKDLLVFRLCTQKQKSLLNIQGELRQLQEGQLLIKAKLWDWLECEELICEVSVVLVSAPLGYCSPTLSKNFCPSNSGGSEQATSRIAKLDAENIGLVFMTVQCCVCCDFQRRKRDRCDFYDADNSGSD